MRLTDRQIIACYFPDRLPQASKLRPKSYREVFWKTAEERGLTPTQIQSAWDRQYGK